MPEDRKEPFRVGVTRDVRRPDGTLAFAPFDLSPLEVDGVAWSFLAEDARPLTPDLLAGLDGLSHVSAASMASSGSRSLRATASGSTSSTCLRARRAGSR